ncbi:MAG: hypothetical protein RL542_434 [Bacteroidota bacterium]|jgi:hypothetical protein
MKLNTLMVQKFKQWLTQLNGITNKRMYNYKE